MLTMSYWVYDYITWIDELYAMCSGKLFDVVNDLHSLCRWNLFYSSWIDNMYTLCSRNSFIFNRSYSLHSLLFDDLRAFNWSFSVYHLPSIRHWKRQL
jgi:hypothetical protein